MNQPQIILRGGRFSVEIGINSSFPLFYMFSGYLSCISISVALLQKVISFTRGLEFEQS